MTTPNPELRLADEFVRYTRCTIFLTGKAGTGKTTFLHNLKKQTHKRMVVTAPTGVAAINAGGVTLHSFFQLPFGPFLPGGQSQAAPHRMSREKQNIIRSLDLLVIDEISMVRADLLDGVDCMLRRYRRSELPFGGVQLLMIGDLHQLSPVAKPSEWQLLETHYPTPFFFSSHVLGRTELVTIELKHIYRQSDSHFISLLNKIRENRLDPSTLDRLNARFKPDFAAVDCAQEGYITLCTHNRGADAINEARLEALPAKGRHFEAGVEGVFPEHSYPTAASLELKLGAQVMFIRNDMSGGKAFFNGKIGKVTGLSKNGVEVTCPGEPEPIVVENSTWENIEYTVEPETAEIKQKIIGTFSQLPLKHAWAITIHKSQGLTFDKAIIDAQAAFAHGQVYVAFSRCRTLEGIMLSSPLKQSAVKADPAIERFVTTAGQAAASPEYLESAKQRYQQQLVLACFSFERLRWLTGRLTGLLRGNADKIQVAGGQDMSAVQKRAEDEICKIGDNFQRQLKGMFGTTLPEADPAIQERLAKASAYFEKKFSEILLSCLESLAVESDNKEIRKKINDALRHFKEECVVKLAAVKSCRNGFSPERYLRMLSSAAIEGTQAAAKSKPQAARYTEADVGHPELFESLRAWRAKKAADEGLAHYQVMHQKTMVRIAIQMPDSLAALGRIKGIGPRLTKRYGRELIDLVIKYSRGKDDGNKAPNMADSANSNVETARAVLGQ